MKAMHERNQVMVAIVGTILAAAAVLGAMNLDKLPFVNPTRTYGADFANADGLRAGNDVRVEGLNVGTVRAVRVAGDHVHVDFTVRSGLSLGAASSASIEVATVLGSLFMQVESAGPGVLRPGDTIPVSRTTVPYTLVDALDQFGTFAQGTDLPVLQQSLRALSATLSGVSPADAKAALQGLASVSQTIAGKQQQISQVLTAAEQITSTLNTNSAALVQLLGNGDAVLQLIQQRQAVIAQLLKDTASLGTQISVLVDRNGAALGSLFANLNTVTGVLTAEQAKLQQAVATLGQFSINIANASGSGPFLDLLSPTVVEPDNVLKACGPTPHATTGPCG